jgi:GntR family transcriptional regulator, transcriptional repressor for pyruvate dehydrogenase complex
VVDIGRVAVPKASDILAEQLRARILSGELPTGTPLPPERSLVESTGLSRTTVREALRILEIQGLLSTRPGRNGGSVVRLPDAAGVSDSLDVFIQGRRIRLDALLETREAIEPLCAALAAGQRDPARLAELDAVNRRMATVIDDIPAYLEANVAWHVAVARASGNELLAAFMSAISRAIHASTDDADFNSLEVRRIALRAHERVTEAIAAGDAPSARRRMARHVCGFASALREEHPGDDIDLDAPARAVPAVNGSRS